MSGEQPTGAFVSAREIYDELRRLSDVVVRLEARLTADNTRERVDELETRVSSLEQRVWRASGVAAALGAVVGVAAPFITK